MRVTHILFITALNFLAFTANAQSADSTISTNSEIAPAAALVNCGKSNISSRQFVELIHAIASHGDLTDIKFIEEKLNIKFKKDDSYYSDSESKVPVWINYKAENLFGPIQVELRLDYRPDYGHDLRFQSFPSSLFVECTHLTTADFATGFNTVFIESPIMDSDRIASGSLTMDKKAKNGADTIVFYTYANKGHVIEDVTIKQSK